MVDQHRWTILAAAAVLTGGLAAAGAAPAAADSAARTPPAPTGIMRDLGTLPGGTYSYVRAINESGQVVGSAGTADGEVHAFRWTPSSGMQDLGTLGGSDSYAQAVNAAGQVTGT